MAIDIADFPINSMVIFHSYVNVYQRVESQEPWLTYWCLVGNGWVAGGCWGLLGVAGMIITSDYGSFPKIPY